MARHDQSDLWVANMVEFIMAATVGFNPPFTLKPRNYFSGVRFIPHFEDIRLYISRSQIYAYYYAYFGHSVSSLRT